MLKSIKEKFSKVTNKMKDGWAVAKSMVMTAICIATASPMSVYAANNDFVKPLLNLKTLMIMILTPAGSIILLYGIISFGESFRKKEQTGEMNAVNVMIFGGILLFADAFLAFLVQ